MLTRRVPTVCLYVQSRVGSRSANGAVVLVNVPRINGGNSGGSPHETAATAAAPGDAPAAPQSSHGGSQLQRQLSFSATQALFLRKLSFKRRGQS